MVLTRLGDFLYRAGWVISGLLLFDVPPTIFAYAGFAAGWTNVADCIALGVFCTTIGCLSWLAGQAMGDVLTPDIERLDMLPRIVRSPVEICFGTSPSHAPRSRPLEKTSPVPIAATIALEMVGPIPGLVISRSQC